MYGSLAGLGGEHAVSCQHGSAQQGRMQWLSAARLGTRTAVSTSFYSGFSQPAQQAFTCDNRS